MISRMLNRQVKDSRCSPGRAGSPGCLERQAEVLQAEGEGLPRPVARGVAAVSRMPPRLHLHRDWLLVGRQNAQRVLFAELGHVPPTHLRRGGRGG